MVTVTDGDTIKVMHSGGASASGCGGIDCPESHQAFGTRAKQFTVDLAFGKVVTVQVMQAIHHGE